MTAAETQVCEGGVCEGQSVCRLGGGVERRWQRRIPQKCLALAEKRNDLRQLVGVESKEPRTSREIWSVGIYHRCARISEQVSLSCQSNHSGIGSAWLWAGRISSRGDKRRLIWKRSRSTHFSRIYQNKTQNKALTIWLNAGFCNLYLWKFFIEKHIYCAPPPICEKLYR